MMKRRTLLAGVVALAAFAAVPAIAQEAVTDTLEISGGFARASPKMVSAGAGFMQITSTGPADRLIGFSSPVCEHGELHTHIHDNGMMRMRQIEAIDIPAGGSAVLAPGGLHLMFIDLVEPLEEGQDVPVTLTFENAGTVELSLPVKGAGAMN